MARATQSPKTGTYQLRKRVPADVRRLVGGPVEVKVSLETKDPARAAEEFRKKDAEFEARWAEIRKGVQDLDHESIEALGGDVYQDLIGRPGKDRGLGTHHSYAWFLFKCEKLDEFMRKAPMDDWWPDLETLHGANLDKALRERGIAVTKRTREDLLLAAHRAGRQAAAVIVRQVGGDYTPDPGVDRFPTLAKDGSTTGKGDFEAVWAAWLKHAKPSPNTLKRWRPVLDRMLAFAGETDLARISEKTLEDWIEALLEELSNNTIAKVHLAAVKRIFGFAKEKKRISFDPASDLSVESGKKYARAMRGYRDDEAALILEACRLPPSERMSPEHRAARRWVPWLCAYTGARVNEMTQLRACDVTDLLGWTFVQITPEAGTAKTGARSVPLHPDLKAQGFLDFVATKSGDEPLFYATSRRRPDGEGSMPPYEEMGTRLSKWVRRLGIEDGHVDPNHAWRHRFKTVAYDCGIEERVADAIQGHAPTSAGRRYGEVTHFAMASAIAKIPRFDPSAVAGQQGASMLGSSASTTGRMASLTLDASLAQRKA